MGDDTYSLSDSPEQKTRYEIYIWIYEPTNREKYIVKGNIIVYLSDNG